MYSFIKSLTFLFLNYQECLIYCIAFKQCNIFLIFFRCLNIIINVHLCLNLLRPITIDQNLTLIFLQFCRVFCSVVLLEEELLQQQIIHPSCWEPHRYGNSHRPQRKFLQWSEPTSSSKDRTRLASKSSFAGLLKASRGILSHDLIRLMSLPGSHVWGFCLENAK